MEIKVYSGDSGAEAGSITVADSVFGRDYSEPLVHQIVTAYMAAARAGTKAQKTRAEVSGGGIKPWRQKGTGRARAGTTRGPLWRKGGRAFAAEPRDFTQKVNRKMYRGAIASILSELIRQDRLRVVDNFAVDNMKTKGLLSKLDKHALTEVFIMADHVDDNLRLAARNLPKVSVKAVTALDPVSLVGFDKTLVTTAAIRKVEEMLG